MSKYRPELPELELPAMEETGVAALRLQGTLAKSLPPMPGGKLQDLYGSNYRQEMQQTESRDIGIANDYTKQQNKRSAARAKARNRMGQKAAENDSKYAYNTRRSQVSNEAKARKAVTRYFAREALGMGPELYR